MSTSAELRAKFDSQKSGEVPCCAGCHTPTRFYAPGGICPTCEQVNDLLDVIIEGGPNVEGRARYAAWILARSIWEKR